MRRGEVVLIRMQFHQTAGAKIRSAAVLLDTGDDDFVAAPITSRPGASEYDVALADWRAAGLNVASFVRVHKVAVLAKAEIIQSVGVVSNADKNALRAALCRAFCPSATG